MNKNRFAVIMVILLIIVGLTFGWFYLQHVMDKYDVDEKDWDETDTSLNVTPPKNSDIILVSECEPDVSTSLL